MRGRIVNNIFFDVPVDAGPVFPPAKEFSGLRPFRLCLLSFAEVFQIQLIDMLKHADAVVKIGCERKNCYRIPAWFGFSPFFWTRRDCFFRFGPGSAFSLFEVETVRLLTLTVCYLNDRLH